SLDAAIACVVDGATLRRDPHSFPTRRSSDLLRKYMPITFVTMVVGTLALVATPFFSGFYSKDTIIEAAKFGAEGKGWVGTYGYWAVLLGAFVTSFYSFRLLYLTFFGKERFREVEQTHPAETHG